MLAENDDAGQTKFKAVVHQVEILRIFVTNKTSKLKHFGLLAQRQYSQDFRLKDDGHTASTPILSVSNVNMDKMNERMKKFTLRGVINGLRTSVTGCSSLTRPGEFDIEETITSDHFQVAKTVRHGFPHQPTALAYDMVQRLLAIGTRNGSIRIFGRPGVDCHVKHNTEAAVIQLLFLINERPREEPRKWCFCSNVHRLGVPCAPCREVSCIASRIISIPDRFISKFVGCFKLATECWSCHQGRLQQFMAQAVHGMASVEDVFLIGALVSACADDQLHLWSLRQKKPEIIHSLKFQRERISFCQLPFQSKWLYVGTERGNVHIVNIETFVLSGYIINWNRIVDLMYKGHPGAVVHISDCPIDPNKLLIGYHSGRLALWDLRNKSVECRYNCAETLRSACWHHEGKQFIGSHGDGSLTIWNARSPQEPQTTMYPHAKLGQDNKSEPCRPVKKVDLRTVRTGKPYIIFSGGLPNKKPGSPSMTVMHGTSTTVLEMEHNIIDFVTICSTPWNNDFQDPYAVIVLLENDLVIVDLSSPGYPCFENPYAMDIHDSPVTSCLYFSECPADLIPALHEVGFVRKKTDYSQKEWPVRGGEAALNNTGCTELIVTGHADGSVKFWDATCATLRVLYKLKTEKAFERPGSSSDSHPFTIEHLSMCAESRLLCVAGSSHVLLYVYDRSECVLEIAALQISLANEVYDGVDTLEIDAGSSPGERDLQSSVKTKAGSRKWPAGYHPSLCCMMTWSETVPTPSITSLSVNSKYGLLAFGSDCGLVVIDIIQKTCILCLSTIDLYGSVDPCLRSPGTTKPTTSRSRPPSIEILSQQQTTPSDESKNHAADQPVGSGQSRSRSPSHSYITPIRLAPPMLSSARRRSFSNELVAINERAAGRGVAPPTQKDIYRSSVTVREYNAMEKTPTLAACARSMTTLVVDGPCGLTDTDILDSNSTLASWHYERRASSPGSRSPDGKLPLKISSSGQTSLDGASRAGARVSDASPLSGSRLMVPGSGSMFLSTQSDSFAASDKSPSPKSPRRLSLALKSFLTSNQSSSNESDEVSDVAPPVSTKGKMKNVRSLMRFMSHSSSQRRAGSKEMTSPMEDDEGLSGDWLMTQRRWSIVEMIDITSDDTNAPTVVQRLSFAEFLGLDRSDNGTSVQSPSSSVSSLDNINKESIQCLTFADAYSKRSDLCMSPSLWAGTSLGSVIAISLYIPENSEARKTDPVTFTLCGTVFRLRGSIKVISFLDCNGVLIPTVADPWRGNNHDESYDEGKKPFSRASPTAPIIASELSMENQFAVVCSEKQARVLLLFNAAAPHTLQSTDYSDSLVIFLPTQTCAYKAKITETSTVAKADVITIRDSVCLACYLLNGRIMTFSLPSLRPLIDVEHISLPDVRVAHTFCFSANCHAVYFCSPAEVQKLAISSQVVEALKDSACELFLPCDTPTAARPGFLKTLFGVGSSTTNDREELFGVGSGSAPKGIAMYTFGVSQPQESANVACSDIARAKQLALERGERLGELEDKTERMKAEAETYSRTANQLKLKFKDKKWYEF